MKKASMVLMAMILSISMSACAGKYKKTEEQTKQPINCATAEGDIRILESEKAHVAERIAAGATAIFPAGLVLGILTGTEDEKIEVAIGEYNKMIDKRIAEIKRECGL